MTTIAFSCLGRPQPKGAHTSFVPTYKDGSPVIGYGGKPKVVTKDTNKNVEPAQEALAVAALSARNRAAERIWDGPAAVTIRYFFARNKGDYGTGRNANTLKESAPTYPLTRADIDKLERTVFDALTGTILRDDKLVVDCTHSKRFVEEGEPERVEVEVELIEQQTVGVVTPREQLALAA